MDTGKKGRTVILDLNKDQDQTRALFRIKKGDSVIFKERPSLFGFKVKVYTEFPDEGETYQRGQYQVLRKNPLTLDRPGCYHYYFVLGDKKIPNGQGYILVEPELRIGTDVLPLDCIQCVTYLSKCLGKLSTWMEKLSVAKESGYNMVHFTPIQELGGSLSAYCLQDQLKMNPSFGNGSSAPSIEEIAQIISIMRNEWKMLSICDIVLNHTANESPWLQEHPESAFNLKNSPHLRPAYVVDALLHKLTLDVAQDKYEMMGLPARINNEDHLNALRYHLGSVLIPQARIHEFFQVDVTKFVKAFQDEIRSAEPFKRAVDECKLRIIQDPSYRRLQSSVDMKLALLIFNVFRNDCFDEDTRQRKCSEAFKAKLDALNGEIEAQVGDHMNSVVNNTVATVRYFRLDPSGPKIPLVTKKDPLVPRYFVERKEPSEENMYNDEAVYIMAHNGWVMDSDPLKNFAEPGSNVYLRRELIAWGDSVKLRYGQKREDCPYLWDRMKKYVEMTAATFDGVRLDNCHSTPIHVAQYLLDAARVVNPELYVVAELFTNSDQTDNIFVNKLGITSLIREAMSGWDSHEEGRLVYRYGGDVIGAFGGDKASRVAHALFMDLTHDNPSPVEKRTLYDLLPSAALVLMASCATGSNMGYDQLVPHHIHVVDESREYMGIGEAKKSGIMEGKLALNKLHFSLAQEGFNQVFVDQIDQDIVCVTRFNPVSLESVVLIAYTAFHWPNDFQSGEGKGVTVSGIVQSVILEAYLDHKSGARYVKPCEYTRKSDVINGLTEFRIHVKESVSVENCEMVQAVPCGLSTRINLTRDFKPGSVVALRIVSRTSAKDAAARLLEGSHFDASELDLATLNYALYRAEGEEDGVGAYNVPGYGNLVYCGIQGAMSVLEDVARTDDLGHPICGNIRAGSWLCSYAADRFEKHRKLKSLGQQLRKEIKLIDELPVSLKPWGTYRVLSQLHGALVQRAVALMPRFVQEGSDLVRHLALCSVQMSGVVKSAPLPPLSDSVRKPQPEIITEENGKKVQLCVTLAAGLPHFTSGYMRSWGRDTFISLRGLMLLSGRFDEARYLILGYGACLRHGLIPNLLDGFSLKPRFNCRDAVWWWLQAIKEFTYLAPTGFDILRDKVNRLFPTDDSPITFVDQELHEVMQEALSVHFQGLCFRERNAGKEIDEHMVSPGFDNQIGVHPNTGFVFGGNEWNCGTWMDKMGSSEKAGNKGKPATPRDGSAVEIVGLSMSVISWLHESHLSGKYPHDGVTRTSKSGTTKWTWSEWSGKIKENFEKEFWVDAQTKANNKYVNRIGIYKDTVGATHPWADFRLRPNFLVAMVVAPKLFTPEKARRALAEAQVLVGPLGMKSLDPSDLAYRGEYDNSNDSTDFNVAHGYNYHQGPEWLWQTGYYLRALLQFSEDRKNTADLIKRHLSTHWAHIESSHWRGLPELTNAQGAFCRDSCATQAWSSATILEVLFDISKVLDEAF